MALGTLTLVKAGGKVPSAPLFAERISVLGDSSYPTGGTASFSATVAAAVGRAVDIVDVISGDCGDNHVEYDAANDKLKVRVISTGAEVANATNQSAVTFNLTVLYK